MSQFRDQFHAAQLSYHSPAYPDDLASLLLPPKRRLWPVVIGTLVAGLAAAVIVIVLLNQVVVPVAQRGDAGREKDLPELASLPGLPEMPQMAGVPAVGEEPLFLPALPSFPSLLEVLGGSSQWNESPKEISAPLESL